MAITLATVPLFTLGLAALIGVSGVEAQAAPRREVENSADAQDKVICKRFTRTGSLVDSYKTCKTKHEWERERDNVRQLGVSDSCRDRGNGGFLCKI